jgi:hypothetical protein
MCSRLHSLTSFISLPPRFLDDVASTIASWLGLLYLLLENHLSCLCSTSTSSANHDRMILISKRSFVYLVTIPSWPYNIVLYCMWKKISYKKITHAASHLPSNKCHLAASRKFHAWGAPLLLSSLFLLIPAPPTLLHLVQMVWPSLPCSTPRCFKSSLKAQHVTDSRSKPQFVLQITAGILDVSSSSWRLVGGNYLLILFSVQVDPSAHTWLNPSILFHKNLSLNSWLVWVESFGSNANTVSSLFWYSWYI